MCPLHSQEESLPASMPITPEEQSLFLSFVQRQADTLRSLSFDPGSIIWHYTGAEAFLKIVETGTIYATQVSCLNDSTEIRYGEELVRAAFSEMRKSVSKNKFAILESVLNQFYPDQTPSQPIYDWFVSCFSQQRDDLSQWRAYGGGENGIAIGFLARGFFSPNNTLARVSYKRATHTRVAIRLAHATLRFYLLGLKNRAPEEHTMWESDFIAHWIGLLNKLAPMVKDFAFHGEKEYRVIHAYQAWEVDQLHFRQKQSLISMHLPLAFPPPNADSAQSKMLPITEVMIGPGRHKDISRISAYVFMRKNGYPQVPITVSSIPFQTV